MNNTITNIEIENGKNDKIVITRNQMKKTIGIFSKLDTHDYIPICNDSLFSFITSLHILYRQIFNIDYPNKDNCLHGTFGGKEHCFKCKPNLIQK